MFDFDPFDPANFVDPYPSYAVLRKEHPVYRREIAEPRVSDHYWMLSRAGDIDQAVADWRTFSSANGVLIDTDSSLIPPNMFNMDPPRHDELRSILSRALTPKRIADLEPHIRRYAREVVEEHRGKGRIDVATDVAQLVPTITMCALMDLPTDEREQFLRWNLDTMAGSDFTSDEALAAYGAMGEYWMGLVEERRRAPGGDLISQILHADVDGAALSDDEVAGFCSLLHDASQNTTMNMIAHGAMVLGRHPSQRGALAREPERWPTAIDELLRFVSPVQGLARSTTRDVTMHGITIPEGDQVLMLYGSANHDPVAHPDPETFGLDRGAKAHWAFGHGIHFCLGNAVARLEVRVTLQVLIDLLGEWSVVEDEVELNQLVPTRGVAHGPLEFVSQ